MKTYGNATFVTCNGEAHSNPFIDNCGQCMPYWGRVPKCPVDGRTLRETNRPTMWGYGAPTLTSESIGYCRTCRKHYTMIDTLKTCKHGALVGRACARCAADGRGDFARYDPYSTEVTT